MKRVVLAALTLLLVPAASARANATVSFTDFAYTPGTVTIDPGQSVTFNGDFASHPLRSARTGTSLTTDTGSSSVKTFPNPGTYRYYCNIHGFKASENQVGGMAGTIIVTGNQPPIAAFTASAETVDPGTTVRFDASGMMGSSDPDGTIESYEWDLDGRGAFVSTGVMPSTSIVYDNVGTADRKITVRLRVMDSGGASSTATRTITVRPSPPADPAPVVTTPVASTVPPPTSPTVAATPVTPPVAPSVAAPLSVTLPAANAISVRAGGRVSLAVRASAGGTAEVTFRRAGRTVGRGRLSFPAGATRNVSVTLTAAARRAVARGSYRVSATVRLTDPSGRRAQVTRTLTLRRR